MEIYGTSEVQAEELMGLMTASKEYLWMMFVSLVHNRECVCVYREKEEGDEGRDHTDMQSKHHLSPICNTE